MLSLYRVETRETEVKKLYGGMSWVELSSFDAIVDGLDISMEYALLMTVLDCSNHLDSHYAAGLHIKEDLVSFVYLE